MRSPRPVNRLIVTADDFGLAREVNEAVEIAHRSGIVTAASLMVGGASAADAVARARALPSLKVGLHVVLVDGLPTLPPSQIPRLVGPTGRLRSDLVRLGLEIASSSEVRRQLRVEIAAQFEAYRGTALPLDHVDVHKHFHLHPVVAQEIIAVGRSSGMRAIRVPIEPQSVLRRAERQWGSPAGYAIAACAAVLRNQTRRAGLLVPDAVFGFAWSGMVTTKRLLGLLANLPAGLIEMYTHPALTDCFEGSAPGYAYATELKALCAPEVMALVKASNLRLSSYTEALQEAGLH
jgi:chitin disaccharide deacetylase